MKMTKLRISFSSFTDSNLETKADSILQNMTGNSNFPTPIPTLAELATALTVYSAALTKAADLGRLNVAEKNKARTTLELLLGQLGMYVMYVANGDEAILTSSGFSLAKANEPQYITNPGMVEIVNGITSGELVSSVKAMKGACSYKHDVTPDPLTPDSVWDSNSTSRSTYTFKNLEPGRKYWFRVAVIGTGEQLAYSSYASQFAQ
ncbi:MAG: fibronectin type III domain-containing protein [Ferruginibacter sp.]